MERSWYRDMSTISIGTSAQNERLMTAVEAILKAPRQ
jgi:hypothetical protein